MDFYCVEYSSICISLVINFVPCISSIFMMAFSTITDDDNDSADGMLYGQTNITENKNYYDDLWSTEALKRAAQHVSSHEMPPTSSTVMSMHDGYEALRRYCMPQCVQCKQTLEEEITHVYSGCGHLVHRECSKNAPECASCHNVSDIIRLFIDIPNMLRVAIPDQPEENEHDIAEKLIAMQNHFETTRTELAEVRAEAHALAGEQLRLTRQLKETRLNMHDAEENLERHFQRYMKLLRDFDALSKQSEKLEHALTNEAEFSPEQSVLDVYEELVKKHKFLDLNDSSNSVAHKSLGITAFLEALHEYRIGKERSQEKRLRLDSQQEQLEQRRAHFLHEKEVLNQLSKKQHEQITALQADEEKEVIVLEHLLQLQMDLQRIVSDAESESLSPRHCQSNVNSSDGTASSLPPPKTFTSIVQLTKGNLKRAIDKLDCLNAEEFEGFSLKKAAQNSFENRQNSTKVCTPQHTSSSSCAKSSHEVQDTSRHRAFEDTAKHSLHASLHTSARKAQGSLLQQMNKPGRLQPTSNSTLFCSGYDKFGRPMHFVRNGSTI